MRKLTLACALALTVAASASADLISSSQFRSLTPRTPTANRTANGDSFSATVTGFSDAGGAFLDDGSGSPVFGGTSLIGLGAVDPMVNINIATIETAGPGANQSTLTFRFFTDDGLGGSPAFAPFGTTLGGDAIGALQFEVGDFNAGLDLVEFTPSTPFTIDSAGVEYFADGGSIAMFPVSIDPAMGAGVFSNSGAGLSFRTAVSVGDGAGGLGDITAFGIDEAVINIVITVPEPGTLSLLGLGALALVRRRRA